MITGLFRRFRGIAIALVVLALSAGAVFAAAPVLNLAGSPGSNGRDQAPGLNKGDQGEDEQTEEAEDGDEDGAESEDAEEPEAPEAPEAEAEGAPEDNHGSLVSVAAQMETPEGFVNHGAFVSCVAHMKDVVVADVDWATVTPEACAAADAARDAAKAEKKALKQAERAQRQAEKGTHGKGAAKRAERAGGQ